MVERKHTFRPEWRRLHSGIPIYYHKLEQRPTELTRKRPEEAPPLGRIPLYTLPDIARRAPLGDAARKVGRQRIISCRTYDNIQGYVQCVFLQRK